MVGHALDADREVLQRLDAVCRRLDELQDAVERLATNKSLSAEDRRKRARLLPAIWAIAQDRAWCAADLSALALTTAGAAPEIVTDTITTLGSIKALGKFLSRISETTAGGFRLEVVDRGSRDGLVYVVRRM